MIRHLKYLLLLMIFAALLVGESFAQSKIGVVSYTYREEFKEDVPATLDKIKELGITNIEISNLFGKTAEEFRKLLDERGMVCTSYGVGYDYLLESTDEAAKDAKTLGAKYVRVAWIPHEPPFDLEDTQKAVKDFNTVGNALHEKGLVFCYHNHGYEFQPYGKGTFFDYIVQNTNPEHVSFELDILWTFHPGQDPAKLLRKYPQRFRLMHVKDLKNGVKGDFSGSTPQENDVTLGTGQIDIPAVWKAAKESNIEYFYIEDESPHIDVQVPESLEYLKSLEKRM